MPYTFNTLDGNDPAAMAALKDRIDANFPEIENLADVPAGGDLIPQPLPNEPAVEPPLEPEHRQEEPQSEFPRDMDALAEICIDLPNFLQAFDFIKARAHLPDSLVIEAIASLSAGHLMLSGAPGTGKTLLARLLAKAFNAKLVEVTANAEWSVYDTIGTLTLSAEKQPRPKHGHITRAIIECLHAVKAYNDDGTRHQAVWLMIDEINRCEIDRAFGALFTALSSNDVGWYTLEYMPELIRVPVPKRFRIIAPLNTFDNRFVTAMSSGLKRRFARVTVPPAATENGALVQSEYDLSVNKAVENLSGMFGPGRSAAGRALLNAAENANVARRVFGFLRGASDSPRLPVGTALVVDTLTHVLMLNEVRSAIGHGKEFLILFDEALAARLISATESDRTRKIVNEEFLVGLTDEFPFLTLVRKRLEAFCRGQE